MYHSFHTFAALFLENDVDIKYYDRPDQLEKQKENIAEKHHRMQFATAM
ncbi:hypothetical protein [Mucilaginibacter sp.]|nr:hypothetical protein [Mucilaginibacter sp.]